MNPLNPCIATMLGLLLGLLSVPVQAAPGQATPPEGLKSKGVDRLEQTTETARAARRMALCIGIDHYQSESYSQLTCAVADARDLGAELKALGYDVTVMTDDAADEELRPTYENLSRELADFTASASNADDTLIISFSGHGDKVGGQTGLLPLDYGPQRHRLITLGALMDDLNQADCRARKKLLILDACRSSAVKPDRLLSSGFLQSLGNPESFLVLTGCGENQSSVEDSNLGHGRLTAMLLEGMRGKAFPKDKEFLLVDQLVDYVQATFRERGWAATQSPDQFGRLTAQVSFDIARRNLPKPPPLSDSDKETVSFLLKKAQAASAKSEHTKAVEYATTALRIDEKNADALAERALGYASLGYPDRAESDASTALEIDPQQMLASYVRGTSLARKSDNVSRQSALALLQKVTAAVEGDPARWPMLASGELACLRLMEIGNVLLEVEQNPAAALAYYTRATQVKEAPAQRIAMALSNRGIAYGRLGQFDKELADFTHVTGMKDAGAEQVAKALFNRSIAYGRMGQWDNELADYNRVIEMKDAGVEQVARALVNRGFALGEMGQLEKSLADFTRVIEMKDASIACVAFALEDRSYLYGRMGQPEKEIADCDRVIAMKDAPADRVASALINRGGAYSELGHPEKEVADCTRVIEMKGASAEMIAVAMVNRGFVYGQTGRREKELADYARVIEMKDAPARQVARALLNRGLTYEQRGQWEKEVDDDTRVIELKGAGVDQVASALVSRSFAYKKLGQPEKELADCMRVIDMKNPPAESLARALIYRGFIYERTGRRTEEIADFTRVIEMKDASPNLRATALVDRGILYALLGQRDKDLPDFTRVIEMKDAPAEQVTKALVNRAIAYERMGQWEKEAADCTRVIGMKQVVPELLANALAYRAFVFGRLGQGDKQMADLTRVIEMKDAPADDVARALISRGLLYGQQHELEKELADDTRVLEMKDAPANQVVSALFNRFLTYAQLNQFEKAAADCTRLLERKDASPNMRGWALTVRGWANYRLGKLDPALDDCRSAISAGANNSIAAYKIAVILLRQGKLSEARTAYEAAVAGGFAVAIAIEDLVELRDKLKGPPETAVFLGWLREVGHDSQGRKNLAAYLKDNPQGPLAGWAKELLAAPATRRGAATQPVDKQSP